MNQDGVACSCAEQRGSNIKLGWISVEQGMERVEVWSNEGRKSWKCKGFIGVCSSTDRCVNIDSCGSGDRAEAVTVAEEKRKCTRRCRLANTCGAGRSGVGPSVVPQRRQIAGRKRKHVAMCHQSNPLLRTSQSLECRS